MQECNEAWAFSYNEGGVASGSIGHREQGVTNVCHSQREGGLCVSHDDGGVACVFDIHSDGGVV